MDGIGIGIGSAGGTLARRRSFPSHRWIGSRWTGSCWTKGGRRICFCGVSTGIDKAVTKALDFYSSSSKSRGLTEVAPISRLVAVGNNSYGGDRSRCLQAANSLEDHHWTDVTSSRNNTGACLGLSSKGTSSVFGIRRGLCSLGNCGGRTGGVLAGPPTATGWLGATQHPHQVLSLLLETDLD